MRRPKILVKKKDKFTFTNQVNFENESIPTTFEEMASIVECENLRIRQKGQTGSVTIHKLDEDDNLLTSMQVNFPFDEYVEQILKEFLFTKTSNTYRLNLPKLPKLKRPNFNLLPKIKNFLTKIHFRAINYFQKAKKFTRKAKNLLFSLKEKAQKFFSYGKAKITKLVKAFHLKRDNQATFEKIKLLPKPKVKVRTGVFVDELGVVYTYRTNAAGAYVSGFKGKTKEVVIKTKIEVFDRIFPVVAIGKSALAQLDLTKIELPETIQIIGAHAFQKNNIISLELPQNLIEIGAYAFYDNHLENVVFSENLTKIGNFAFGKNHLTQLSFPKSLREIGYNAFSENLLTTINWNNTTPKILNYAFCANKFLEISLPQEINLIGANVFDGNVFIRR